MLLDLKKDIVYGPVKSRRLGKSLGINILPSSEKVCTFNCLYCQYGWTDFSKLRNASFPTVQRIEDAIKKSLETLSAAPRYITFSGNGEPTLHPEFPTIVDAVTHLRNRLSPSSKIAILSNSSTVHDPAIRETLEKLDVRIMKLDAGCDRTFETYNKPVKGIHLDTICEGLSLLKDVIIQSLFSDGRLGNTTEKNIREWVSRIGQISPTAVQIYTLDRGYPSKSISKCNQNGLRSIQTLLQKIHIHAEVY